MKKLIIILLMPFLIVTSCSLAEPSNIQDVNIIGMENTNLLGQGARAYQSATQSVPNDTITILSLDAETYDTDDIHDNVTENSKMICQTDGFYLIIGQVAFNAINDQKIAQARLHLNGVMAILTQVTISGTKAVRVQVTDIEYLTVGDYIQLAAYHDSGVAVTTSTNILMIQRIGDYVDWEEEMMMMGGSGGEELLESKELSKISENITQGGY